MSALEIIKIVPPKRIIGAISLEYFYLLLDEYLHELTLDGSSCLMRSISEPSSNRYAAYLFEAGTKKMAVRGGHKEHRILIGMRIS